jgi:hypothetical protein
MEAARAFPPGQGLGHEGGLGRVAPQRLEVDADREGARDGQEGHLAAVGQVEAQGMTFDLRTAVGGSPEGEPGRRLVEIAAQDLPQGGVAHVEAAAVPRKSKAPGPLPLLLVEALGSERDFGVGRLQPAPPHVDLVGPEPRMPFGPKPSGRRTDGSLIDTGRGERFSRHGPTG